VFARMRWSAFLLTLALFWQGVVGTAQAAGEQPPVMHGRAAVLLDGTTGQLLYQFNPTNRNYPASTTKLLTALVAVEHGQMDQQITVSQQAVEKPWDSSSCYLNANESQPLRYLLYGLLLASGNDCADAIAEGVGGGDPAKFVRWMNETAQRIGATQSYFVNPSGLHNDNHYTTALDLALIARAALANPDVRKIAGTKAFDWPGKEQNGTYYNHDSMLWDYPGTIGGKTGFTDEAGLTLVNAAERDGLYLIAVVMGYESRDQELADIKALMDWGFAQFTQSNLLSPEQTIATVPVADGTAPSVSASVPKPYTVAVPKESGVAQNLIRKVKPMPQLNAPVRAGDQVGTVEIWEGERLLQILPLVAQTGVAAAPVSLIKRGMGVVAQGLIWFSYIGAGLLLLLLVLRGVGAMVQYRRRGQQRVGRRDLNRYPRTFR
jgi:D-alanyl-D-alanine carboxypeptidase (penicillin-binding protein 5/6)